jgi:hypothetical protein
MYHTPPDSTVSLTGNRSSTPTGDRHTRSGSTVASPYDSAEERGGGTERQVLNGSPLVRAGQRGRVRLLPRRSIAACAIAVSAFAVAGGGAASGSASATSLSSYTASSSYTAASSTSTTYPAGKKQVCQARAQLKTSVEALVKPSTLTSGRTAIKADVSQVQTNLNNFKKAAKKDYKPQVDAVEASVQQVKTAVGKMGNGQVSKNLEAVGSAITQVGTTSAALFAETKASCES